MTRGIHLEVPFTRLDHAEPALFAELMEAVEGVASGAAFILGEEVERFEAEFAAYCEARAAVGVSSGTEAIALALRALGVGPGDEVIVPANSFIATAEAVTLAGARPRLVDVDPESGTLTAKIVEAALTPRTRCVIPVHLYGRAVDDLEPIVELARERRLAVVEDACQAHGARYRGRRVGTIGHCGCFSFYPAKNLGAWGDAGAVVTDDPGVAERLRLLRSHGEHPKHRHRVSAGTARLDAIQAAVLRVKLRRLDDWTAERRRLAGALTERLADAPIDPPPEPDAEEAHVHHLYVVQSEDRNALREHLGRRGIQSAVHYPLPIHLQEAFSHLGLGTGALPAAERLARRVLSLPLFPGMTEEQLERVGRAVGEFARQREPVAAGAV